jgi:hypothetical protein
MCVSNLDKAHVWRDGRRQCVAGDELLHCHGVNEDTKIRQQETENKESVQS